MTEFIKAFKDTSYYQKLFDSHEVLGIYLAGSMCTGVTDERSDYDITIITLDGEDYIDASKYEYLMYKDKKVHWYYRSIKNLFDGKHSDSKVYVGTMLLRNIREDLIIYENPKYSDMLHKLYDIKDRLSDLGMYRLYEVWKDYVDDVLNEGKVLEKHHTKYLYHLCLASYYLMGEEPDKDFLRKIKRIRWQPVSDEYKSLAVERLRVYKDYIESNPIEVVNTFDDLYKEVGKQI